MENWYRDDSNGIRIGKDETSLKVILGAWKKTYADTLQNRIEVLQEIRRVHGTEVFQKYFWKFSKKRAESGVSGVILAEREKSPFQRLRCV